ncbi:cation-transporting P-type ATPase [Halopseudomonas salegens]|uniref:Plasma-membrane calcium-translocating P-type ATPase/potassium and/or sodium efflux P-type ATPase,TIGR01523 n=1 Tax=Halopseudomonas salegens TaxID=1434072 RepID=A0A1H2FKA8_9GAMM|nr:cation-transporting P-type ATPase [Halopseudomonas salegens]SDU07732.1 plasma-membrane calcium-translocating P-type ATPase/potassium and/or sodium efflux P-type ATPase,TIGR01523 [Halopseudomonas salegens]
MHKDQQTPDTLPAYQLSPEECLLQLQSDEQGLSQLQADQRLQDTGPNRLPVAAKEGLLKRFFKHFHDILIYILLVAAGATALLGHWIDTGVILVVVIINATIGFIQEGKAEQALAGIRKMLSQRATAKRDGDWQEIEAEHLVPGDIVRLRSGDRVPADLRLLECNNLRIEESALTGESMPADKNTETATAATSLGDRSGMAYSGTLVAAGRGLGVVSATGSATELGRINRLIADVETLQTPLTRQMAQFSKILSVVIVGLAGLMLLVGILLHDFALSELFLAAIGFAVAAIPEGLPAILTITLALGVQRMAKRNAITRKLNAVETLGSVTVICSDKTGTLTRNEMTTRHVVTAAHSYHVSGTGYAPEGEISCDDDPIKAAQRVDLDALLETVAIANDSRVEATNGQWQVIGEPTEGALCTLVHKAGFEAHNYQRIAEIPFESDNKFMATLADTPDGERRILLKGAPDRLLERCRLQLDANGNTRPLDPTWWEQQLNQLSGEGLRVLAAAARTVPVSKDTLSIDDLDDLVFLGLIGIIDPPRPEAIEAIASCHAAGIRVKMITGDHAGTAEAIGREMGIGTDADPKVISGAEIEAASDEELARLAQTCDIFARTSPEHKLRLVKALQATNEIVAMTGDGVNDAPALKRADVGIAMGIKGTEATKEAADIVLADDNFSSIAQAVEEGRTIYDNLRKAIMFLLPTNGAQGLVILAAVVLGMVLPITPVQVLWVNMIVAVTLALALAFEPAEPGLMQRPPRDPGAAIISLVFLIRIGLVSVLIGAATIVVFQWQIRIGTELDMARSTAINTLVIAQACYLFNSRFLATHSLNPALLFTNKVAWLTIGILLLLQMAFIYLPFMNTAFGTTPLALQHWLMPLAVGIGVFLVIEGEKWVWQRLR